MSLQITKKGNKIKVEKNSIVQYQSFYSNL